MHPEYWPGSAWRGLIREWERALKSDNKSPNTIRIYVHAVESFVSWLSAEDRRTEPDKVEPGHIRDFAAHVTEVNSAGDSNNKYRALRIFFKFLVDEEEIDRTPFDRTKAPTVPERPIPIVRDDFVTDLLKACEGKGFLERRDTALIRLFFDSGARLAEITNLTLEDVDLDLDIIRVLGKGRRHRSIPFDAKTGRALSRYLRERDKVAKPGETRLWVSRSGIHLTRRSIARALERRGEQAGQRLHPHQFRHSLAHYWRVNQGDETDLMRIMGWKSREMLSRYGASAADERAHETKKRMRLGDRL